MLGFEVCYEFNPRTDGSEYHNQTIINTIKKLKRQTQDLTWEKTRWEKKNPTKNNLLIESYDYMTVSFNSLNLILCFAQTLESRLQSL